MAARYNGPPAQMLSAGLSRAENTPTATGATTTCHLGGLSVHKDRAPAQTEAAPVTMNTLARGLAQTWLTVPLNRYSDAPETKNPSAAHHQAEYAERVLR